MDPRALVFWFAVATTMWPAVFFWRERVVGSNLWARLHGRPRRAANRW